MYYRLFETALGWAAMIGSDAGVTDFELPRPSREEALRGIASKTAGNAREERNAFGLVVASLQSYFAGNRVDFQWSADFRSASEFDISVWNEARTIAYGEVVAYSEIARRIGRPGACRAVGQALGRNPIPVLVPCHRVLRKGGGLGGFACGLDWKRRLLSIEGSFRSER